MSPTRVPPSSGEPQRDAARFPGLTVGSRAAPPREPVERGEAKTGRRTLAAAVLFLAAWLIYAAIYACVFVLSGFPAWTAVRAAACNALPDGFLALAVLATTRRLASPGVGRGRFLIAHAALAPLLAAIAAGLKSLLLWADVVRMGSGGTYRFDGAILTWQLFLSLLIYAAVAGASHARANAWRLRQVSEAAEKSEMLRARAELSALRAQLNPHFLFNVLHSVLGLVRRDPDLAEQALERLGDLLRYALHVHREGVDWTSLRKEWEFMECYLDLEKIRLVERLQVFLEADPSAFDRLVPSFLLQPLVENAVRHGIAPRAAGGSLHVSAALVGTDLRLQVDNDGVRAQGDPAGTGVQTDRDPELPHEGEPSGLGLRLLHDRLFALYGSRAEISSGPTSEGGFRVVLRLPDVGGADEVALPWTLPGREAAE
jgi:uncharacterized membrane protein YhdT